MTRAHPYVGLPDRQFWKRGGRGADFDPVTEVPFRIGPADRVVTAGSCFAQHVARSLSEAGFTHFVTEPAHPLFSPDLARDFGYGVFSARYGNVYTARQFLQLLQRAYGLFVPLADAWTCDHGEGRVVDPFRPQIQPQGFAMAEELAADRVQHFAAIRRAVEQADVIVFTLGLTEAWEDTRDGAIFPLAPGVAGGVHDPDLVRFRNFDETETAADLSAALTFLRARNPGLRIVLTVSPVPLNATYVPRHVAVSTAWSKAALRIAAERVTRSLPDCVYFPSYEVITSPLTAGRYFGPDGREVLPEGVAHVMRLFLRHFGDAEGAAPATTADPAPDAHAAEMQRLMDVLCDEEAIDNRPG